MRQRGIALLTGLLLLAALTLLALASARGMVEQRQLAGNFESRRLALENARLAEATALAWLYSRADIERQPGCVEDCLLPVAILAPGALPDRPEFESAAWWRSNGYLAGSNPETGDLVSGGGSGRQPARWVIEERHYEPASETGTRDVGYYRIVTRGTGKQATSVAVGEAIVARPWGEAVEPLTFPLAPGSAAFCAQFGSGTPCGILAWRQIR